MSTEERQVLRQMLSDLRRGRFRPWAISRFVRSGLAYAVSVAWSARSLRRSFYLASVAMAALLAVLLSVAHWAMPMGLPGKLYGVQAALFLCVFVLTLLQLGLVREEQSGRIYDRFVFPNVLTLLRLQAVPLLYHLVLRSSDLSAGSAGAWTGFGILVLAVATDFLDGTLSRLLNQRSDFGRIYDPVVDVFFHTVLAVACFRAGYAGVAYLTLVLARFLTAPLLGSFLYLFKEPFQVKSTVMGKVSSSALSVFMVVVLLFRASGWAWLASVAWPWLEYAAEVACAATVVFFLAKGLRLARGVRW